MREICEKIEINPQQLYNGCIFMAVAHAVTVGEYPELNYEHSWDGINYSNFPHSKPAENL